MTRLLLFGCDNVDLLSFVPLNDLGGGRGARLNDIWGWTDPETGVEYALVGRTDGTSFVDISNPSNPVLVGTLALTEGASPASWRDIKVYNDHAFVVADGIWAAWNASIRSYPTAQCRRKCHADGV